MKMRLTPPVAAQGAWLIAGRSAAGAVLLALTVSACTGGGSSVPTIFTPTAPGTGHSSSTGAGTRTPSPTGQASRSSTALGQRHLDRPGWRFCFWHASPESRAPRVPRTRQARPTRRVPRTPRVRPTRRVPRRSSSAHASSSPTPRPADAHVVPGVPHGRTGDRRRGHGRPAGRRAVRRGRHGGPRRLRHPRLPQAPVPQVRRGSPRPARPGEPRPARPGDQAFRDPSPRDPASR